MTNSNKARLTLDMDSKEHAYLKMACAKLRVSMRQFMLLATFEKMEKMEDDWLAGKAHVTLMRITAREEKNIILEKSKRDLPFYDGDYIHRILSKGSLKNSYQESLLGHFGPISTFTNSSTDVKPFQGTGTPGIFLDSIYTSEKVTVVTHAVEQSTVDGHFPSDHMPMLIDFIIN